MSKDAPGLALHQALANSMCRLYGCNDAWFVATVIAASEALQNGHSCLYLPDWAEREVDGVNGATVVLPTLAAWLQNLGDLALSPGDNMPLVLGEQRLYLRRYWQFEQTLAAALRPRLAPLPVPNVAQARQVLDALFPARTAGEEADWQKVAAANALLQGFSVVAGGPGTGKTYTVTRLLACLIECLGAERRAEPLVICMAAPTGKAAQRLAESVTAARAGLLGRVSAEVLSAIPETGTTLHRLLGVIPNARQFRHNESNLLRVDILVVDEASMVDLPLMTRLFRALPRHCRVILLGDPNQLPSVAAGSVLADLAAGVAPVYSMQRRANLAALGIEIPGGEQAIGANPGSANASFLETGPMDYVSLLRESRRFDGAGGIGRLAAQVLAGAAEASLHTLKMAGENLLWIAQEQFTATVLRWIDTYYRSIATAESVDAAFQQLQQFRILCPARGGPRGVEAINRMVLSRLNPAGAAQYPGKPIMVTRNQYDLGLYNGDVGVFWPDEAGQLMVWFQTGDGYRPMAPGRLPEHEVVYAMTIHKTQGSEFDRVALLLPEQGRASLPRELLYTGITRARQTLEVLAAERVWLAAVEQRVRRDSGLAALLQPISPATLPSSHTLASSMPPSAAGGSPATKTR